MPVSTSQKTKGSVLIIDECPGTIVADFETLMDFVNGGVRSTGKYHLLPMARLNELDERMTQPLRPKLQRPQQRSFPHLHGLYLLLRTTLIGIPSGNGKTLGSLGLNPFMCDQWKRLNPIERYCNLLEAWFRISSFESLGGRRRSTFHSPGLEALGILRNIPMEGRRFSRKEQSERRFMHSEEQATVLALLELFGLVSVERGEPAEGKGWTIASVSRRPLGEQILPFLFDELLSSRVAKEGSALGAWQSSLGSFFPHWKNSLQFPEAEFRDGTYYFKISLGMPWRRIAIPAESSLDDLARSIIDAFDFDGDHLYGFQVPQPNGTTIHVEHPSVQDTDMNTDEFAVGHLDIEEGQLIPFVYDYGAQWEFNVKLEKVTPPDKKITHAVVVASRGNAPAEYGDDE